MSRDIRPLMPALWLQAHVATGLLAYGALAVSAALAMVSLAGVEEKNTAPGTETSDKSDWSMQYWRIPDRQELERYIHGLIVFGFFFCRCLSLQALYGRRKPGDVGGAGTPRKPGPWRLG